MWELIGENEGLMRSLDDIVVVVVGETILFLNPLSFSCISCLQRINLFPGYLLFGFAALSRPSARKYLSESIAGDYLG